MTTFTDASRSNFNGGATAVATSADILWRDQAGNNVLWLMNNDTPSTMATLPVVTPDWHFKTAADFDTGLGAADILWQNDNGALALWGMNGTTVVSISALPNPGSTWHVVADNDFNGDLADDIFFQNDDGSVALWTITSASPPTISGMFAGIENRGPTWHVDPPRAGQPAESSYVAQGADRCGQDQLPAEVRTGSLRTEGSRQERQSSHRRSEDELPGQVRERNVSRAAPVTACRADLYCRIAGHLRCRQDYPAESTIDFT